MLSSKDYAQAIHESVAHLQLEISSVADRGETAQICGVVRRLFRGPNEWLNTPRSISVAIDSPEPWAPDGLGRVPLNSLTPGRVLEAVVLQTEEGLEVALDLCRVLSAVSNTPQVTWPVE